MTYKRIARVLSVSPASAFAWTRDIALTPEQVARNRVHEADPAVIAARAATWRRKNRERRLAFQDEGRVRARTADPLHQAGCMLYWAEGTKERNCAKLANSDPHMVRFFVRFLRECFRVRNEHLSLRLNVYLGNDLALGDIEAYWLEVLGLPTSALRRHSIDHFPASSSGRKRNKLPYGVCTVRAGSTRIVQHIYGAIQEYADFDEPRWVD